MEETWIQVLTILASNLLILLTFFGISVSLHNGIREEIREIRKDMKDFHKKLTEQDKNFHEKLAAQDLEFKTKFLLLEERGKK